MPDDVQFDAQSNLLSFPEIARFVRCVASMGVANVRLTGGEPLLRPHVDRLIATLLDVDGVDDVALTTNAMLLTQQLPKLVAAGLRRINISLDTLSSKTFKELTRREGLDRILAAIEATRAYPELKVKLNSLVLRDVNSQDVIDLVEFASARDMNIRFIEFMPLDADGRWSEDRMLPGAELRKQLESRFGPLESIAGLDPSQPSRDFRLAAGGRVGFIDSVTNPFCGTCDRLRLTADGKIRNCLFGQEEWDVRELLQSADNPSELEQAVRTCISAKNPSHGIADPDFRPPERAMYQIGG